MAVDVSLTSVTSGFNLSVINTNFLAIQTALQDALSRSNSGPNQMVGNLDMNNYNVINAGLVAADSMTIGGTSVLTLATSVTPRGVWATSTAYAVGDLVKGDGEDITYIAVTAHTSGTFITDRDTNDYWIVFASPVNTIREPERFSGDGSDVTFSLSVSPSNERDIMVFIDGVHQNHDTFTLASGTITFSEAPPVGTNNIEVWYSTGTTTFVVNSTVPSIFPVGSAAAPSITFLGDEDTGIFRKAANAIGWTTGGVESMSLDSAGTVTLNSTTDVKLNISGSANPRALWTPTAGDQYGVDFASGGLRIRNFTDSRTEMQFDGTGRIIIGHSANVTAANVNAPLQLHAASGANFNIVNYENNANGPNLVLAHTRSATVGTVGTILSDGDIAGNIVWVADDGTDLNSVVATIRGRIDGTPGANDTPGRLVFETTADGASTSTERMRIDSSGNVGVGETGPESRLHVTGSGVKLILENQNAQKWSIGQATVVDEFTVRDETLGINRLHIDNSGHVMIGKTSPQLAGALFQVANTSSNGQLFLGNSSGTGYVIGRDNVSTGDFRIGVAANDAATSVTDIIRFVVADNALSLPFGKIKFPATQVPSSDVNTLDDYEEGTFTPVIVGTTTPGSQTYSIQIGTYTKIGRSVHVAIDVRLSALDAATNGIIEITGLPFTSNASAGLQSGTIGFWSSLATNNVYVGCYINPNTARLVMSKLVSATTGTTQILHTDLSATTRFVCSLTYVV